MKVLLVTSWNQPACGIQEHSRMLLQYAMVADLDLQIVPDADALDPGHYSIRSLVHDAAVSGIDLVHLNYHRALHSRWHPEQVRELQQAGYKVVITFHDTFGENPPDPLSTELCEIADAFIVHEPCVGLPRAVYWRMGVPEYTGLQGLRGYGQEARPFVGTVGFDFPWKNYDLLCATAREVGWGVVVCCPAMDETRETLLRQLNPWLIVHRGLQQDMVVATLHACDATAFLYTCANSGQSGAVCLGIAARKPVLAFSTCRQFRALWGDDLGRQQIDWCETFQDVACTLRGMPCQRFDAGVVALAERESWLGLGEQYAELYRGLLQ